MGTKCSHNCLNQSLKTNKVKYQLSSSWFKNQTMQLHEMLPNEEYVILKIKNFMILNFNFWIWLKSEIRFTNRNSFIRWYYINQFNIMGMNLIFWTFLAFFTLNLKNRWALRNDMRHTFEWLFLFSRLFRIVFLIEIQADVCSKYEVSSILQMHIFLNR